jgi:hypothetical protein
MSMDDPEDLIMDGLIGGASWLADTFKDTAAPRRRHAKSPVQPDKVEEPSPKQAEADSGPWSCPSCGASNSGRAEFCSLCTKLRPTSPEN